MISRRVFLTGLCAGTCVLASPVAYAQDILAADEAYRRAADGDLILIDVRSRREWAQTGVAKNAHTIWIRDPELGKKLESVTGGDNTKPVALICATGMRSRALADAMVRAGYSSVYNVSEGMIGSSAGPGWLSRGLPVVQAK